MKLYTSAHMETQTDNEDQFHAVTARDRTLANTGSFTTRNTKLNSEKQDDSSDHSIIIHTSHL
jgi:hypothetical protein